MNYFPNIEKLQMISELLRNDNSKSKLEYCVHLYLMEDYKCFNKSSDYWNTATLITNRLLDKEFQKLIKKGTTNFILSKIDNLIVSTLLEKSSDKPSNKPTIDTINPDMSDDESWRMVCP